MDTSQTTVPFEEPRNIYTNQLCSLVPPLSTGFYT